MITATIVAQYFETRTYQTIDWDWWADWLENEDPQFTPTTMGQAYNTIANLASRAVIKKTASVYSKKWWSKELTTQERRVRQAAPQDYQQEAKTLQKMIRTSKRKCWQKCL